MWQGYFFLSLLSPNFDVRLSSNFHRFVILCICWDTPSEKTCLWQLPTVSSGFKIVAFDLDSSILVNIMWTPLITTKNPPFKNQSKLSSSNPPKCLQSYIDVNSFKHFQFIRAIPNAWILINPTNRNSLHIRTQEFTENACEKANWPNTWHFLHLIEPQTSAACHWRSISLFVGPRGSMNAGKGKPLSCNAISWANETILQVRRITFRCTYKLGKNSPGTHWKFQGKVFQTRKTFYGVYLVLQSFRNC